MRSKGTSKIQKKWTNGQRYKTTNGQTQKIKVKTEGPIFLFFMLCFLSFFGGPICILSQFVLSAINDFKIVVISKVILHKMNKEFATVNNVLVL